MESQPSQSPPPDGKPGAVTTSSAGGDTGVTTQPAVRRYPKPPHLLMRLVLLCLRPESWAETARYPTRFTLTALLLAVILSALGTGIAESWQNFSAMRDFATKYDSHGYPALELNSDGELTAKGPLETPIRVNLPNSMIFVDPTGKTTPESLRVPSLFVNNKEVMVVGPKGAMFTLKLPAILPAYGVELPKAGQSKTVTSASLLGFLDRHAAPYIVLMSGGIAFSQALGEALWVLMMLFLLAPLVTLAAAGPQMDSDASARRLILPQRAAYRMVAGVLVPLVMLGTLLRIIGHPVTGLLEPEQAMIFWTLAAAALAVWTGFMAKKMYSPKARERK